MQPKEKPANDTGNAWSGRFSEPVAELVKRYTASVDFDKRLAEFDIARLRWRTRACCMRSACSQPRILPISSAA